MRRHSPDSMSLPAAVVFRHEAVTPGTVCGCGSDAASAGLPGHLPGLSAYRFLSEAPSGQLLSVRYGGILFQNNCRSSSGRVYPAVPADADGRFRVHGRPAFLAGRGSALPVRQAAVSAEGFRQKRCRS